MAKILTTLFSMAASGLGAGVAEAAGPLLSVKCGSPGGAVPPRVNVGVAVGVAAGAGVGSCARAELAANSSAAAKGAKASRVFKMSGGE